MNELQLQELNKKLAEWVGFKFSHKNRAKNFFTGALGKMVKFWIYPNGDVNELPNFTQFLDACFKWLVPERIAEITFMYASNCVSCDIEDLDSNFYEGHFNTVSIEEAWTKSALALCLAIEKLIDGDRK